MDKDGRSLIEASQTIHTQSAFGSCGANVAESMALRLRLIFNDGGTLNSSRAIGESPDGRLFPLSESKRNAVNFSSAWPLLATTLRKGW
jgi:hypothetical protein